MYFHVNASSPKLLEVAASNFAAAKVTYVMGTGQHVKVRGQIMYFLPKPHDIAT